MNVCVSGTKDRAGGPRQQAKAVEIIAKGQCAQQQHGVGNKVTQNLWIGNEVSFGIKSDLVHQKIGKRKHQRAAYGQEDKTVLDEVEERQHEYVEANIAKVDRIGAPEIPGPEQA